MRSRLIELRERRAALAARARMEREALEGWLARADVVAGWVGAGRDLGRAVLRRPWLVAAAVALLVALRPRRTLKWIATGWWLARSARKVWRAWQRLAPQTARAG
ncbi:MAG: hypothetical protein AB1773_04730 [Pseudomonadota bacterium]